MESETTNTPSILQACTSIKLWELSSSIKLGQFRCICSGTRDTLKRLICQFLSQALFLYICQFHMNLYIQNSWPPWQSTFLCQCWQFRAGKRFHRNWPTNSEVTPTPPIISQLVCALHSPLQTLDYFWSFYLDFLCEKSATPNWLSPNAQYPLFSNRHCTGSIASRPRNCHPAPSRVSFNHPIIF